MPQSRPTLQVTALEAANLSPATLTRVHLCVAHVHALDRCKSHETTRQVQESRESASNHSLRSESASNHSLRLPGSTETCRTLTHLQRVRANLCDCVGGWSEEAREAAWMKEAALLMVMVV